MNKAILLAAYGSRHENSIAALTHMENCVRAAWPDIEVAKAYTSHQVRGRMVKKGEQADSVPEALERLLSKGVKRVAIQSLHVIPGSEFHALPPLAEKFMSQKDGFDRIEIGLPLLAGEEDIEQVAQAIISVLPPHRKEQEAVILMGHGTMHSGNSYYSKLHDCIQQQDSDVFVGALEAEPSVQTIRSLLLAKGIKKAFLLPLLFGVGYHASKDMAGKASDSWKSILEESGICCEAILKGAAEYDELASIWLTHLNETMKRLDKN